MSTPRQLNLLAVIEEMSSYLDQEVVVEFDALAGWIKQLESVFVEMEP